MENKLLTVLFVLIVTPPLASAGPGIPFEVLRNQIEKIAKQVTVLDNRVNRLELTFVCGFGGPTRFVDNGDGTICDNQTGMMWEKKDAADGIEDLSNPHDVDNLYSWTSVADAPNPDIAIDLTDPDGTVFTDFLARLNNTVASSPDDLPFAGYTDWRIPTFAELRAIHLGGMCEPCWFPEFVPTHDFSAHWSFTTSATDPSLVWVLFFGAGDLWEEEPKWKLTRPVRAVRGPIYRFRR